MLKVTSFDGYHGERVTNHDSQEALTSWLQKENEVLAYICYSQGITAGAEISVKAVKAVKSAHET